MMTSQPDALRVAVEKLHDCRATFREVARVVEAFEGRTAWEGDVYVYDIEGHPTAARAYAWAETIPDTGKERTYAVLQAEPVKTPADAVRATIADELRRSFDRG